MSSELPEQAGAANNAEEYAQFLAEHPEIAKKVSVLKQIGQALVETVEEAGPLGAPSGPMYAAVMTLGITLDQYEQIMAGLVAAGRLRKSGDCYFLAGGK